MHTDDTTISIPLTRGKTAVIDAEDLSLVSGRSWVAISVGRRWYALSRESGGSLLMHRHLMAADAGVDIDHADGDGLNNRRGNLRSASRSQNMANVPIRVGNRSGYKGVSWHTGARRWRATIKRDYKQVHLGFYEDPRDAALAYDRAARELFGEFAHCNFP